MKAILAAGAIVGAMSAAHAGTTIVNLSASSTNPNAGKNSGSYAYNPVNLSLGAGTYTISIAGISGGGAYDGYAIYAPSAGNAAYTDASWSVSTNSGTSALYTQGNVGGTVADYDGNFKAGRYNTAAAAYAGYQGASYTLVLASAQTVSFYVDDASSPYFQDDSGGVSLAVSAVPEPASFAILGLGVAGLVAARRARRVKASVA